MLSKIHGRRAVALVAGVALAAGTFLASAPASSAAAGDVVGDYNTGAVTQAVVTSGSYSWTLSTAGGSSTLSRVGPDGSIVQVPLAADGQGLTADPSGNVWVAAQTPATIFKVTPDMVTSTYTVDAGYDPYGIAYYDGYVWFTNFFGNSVVKMSTSGSVNATYDTSSVGSRARKITGGPDGSGVLYFGTTGNALGRISTSGAVSSVSTGSAATTVTDDPTLVGGGMGVWFLRTLGGAVVPAKVVGDASVIVLSSLTFTANQMGPGVADTFWLVSSNGTQAAQYDNDGVQLQEFSVGPGPRGASQSSYDGALWIVNGTKTLKYDAGVRPMSSAAPEVTPTTGIVAGSTLTTTNGTWKYAGGATYSYEWQKCSSSDPTSCGDVTGSNAQTFVVATEDLGMYVRSCVKPSSAPTAACSAPLAMGSNAPDPVTPEPKPAIGTTATIGNGVVMEIEAPNRQRRTKKVWYEVFFSADDPQGTVTFQFKKGSKTKTKTVPVVDGVAEYKWKPGKKWRTGRTTVTATYLPSTGSPYEAAAVEARPRIRR